jgi:SSS family solute:Na+ symporter
LTIVYQELPEKFDMILSPDNPSYENLPGIWILLGAGVWIGHFAYWGFNQYITQRALGAKSIKEGPKGCDVCCILKVINAFGDCVARYMRSNFISSSRKI